MESNNIRNRRLVMRNADLKWYNNNTEIQSFNYSRSSDVDYDLFYETNDNNNYEKIIVKNNVLGYNLTQDYDNPLIVMFGFNGIIYSIIQDTNGKYLIGGNFTEYSGITRNRIIRLNQDGSIDNTFNSGDEFDNRVNSIIQDTNGKYVIGGYFTSYSGVTANYIIRLNQDGSIDNTFNSGSGFDNYTHTLIQDTNGKYLIGGNFTEYSGITRNRIIRLNQDGSIDNTFNSGDEFDNRVNSIIQDTNGKYVIGGYFTSYSGITRNRIIRLNQDGSIDNTFNSGSGFNDNINTIIQDTNSKYVIGGLFTSYSGITKNRIIRLNQDGSIDNTFNSGSGFGGSGGGSSIIQDKNNKYLIGGNFTSYSGITKNRIIRLNQDGSIDNTFNSGIGFNSVVNSIIQDKNSKYLIGGVFTKYNNQPINYFIGLNQDGTSNTITP